MYISQLAGGLGVGIYLWLAVLSFVAGVVIEAFISIMRLAFEKDQLVT